MKIVRIRMKNFRCIREAEIFPCEHNVLLGPNNSGKTAVLEGLNLLLNPESAYWSDLIDENDFYLRQYQVTLQVGSSPSDTSQEETETNEEDSEMAEDLGSAPEVSDRQAVRIRIEAVIADLSQEDQDIFSRGGNVIPWDSMKREVRESAEEGEDPYDGAEPCIRVVFEAWYNPEEDDFERIWYFLQHANDDPEACPKFTREHKRQIGFLIYRDIRGLAKPITLHEASLFLKLLRSQDVITQGFEDVLRDLDGILKPITTRPDFASVLNSYKAELENFLALGLEERQSLSFELTDFTRTEVKSASQLYVTDKVALPLQRAGAGTRSLALLGILTLIVRRRNRGILALEEPETFLFPHAQRRVTDECLSLASQTFVTTHSPYVLERMPVEGIGRLVRDSNGVVNWIPLQTADVKQLNLYSKRLRQSFAEALLGRAVIVLEGDSDRWWLYGASRLLHRKIVKGCRLEALELMGISVVSADTFGDIPKLCAFFRSAGLATVALFDHFDDREFNELYGTLDPNVPTLFLRQRGLEALLAQHLPLHIVESVLVAPSYSKSAPLDKPQVDALDEVGARNELEAMLKRNKGSAAFHEYIISLLEHDSVPSPLVAVVSIICTLMNDGTQFGICSLSE
ncbi:MAG: AAA family ATPase [Candidatus Hydrogenedentales bacterium]|jgi:putative ATP-dependent endonuclease of OLD family